MISSIQPISSSLGGLCTRFHSFVFCVPVRYECNISYKVFAGATSFANVDSPLASINIKALLFIDAICSGVQLSVSISADVTIDVNSSNICCARSSESRIDSKKPRGNT